MSAGVRGVIWIFAGVLAFDLWLLWLVAGPLSRRQGQPPLPPLSMAEQLEQIRRLPEANLR